MISEQLLLIILFVVNFFLIWNILCYKESRGGLIAGLDIFGILSEYVIVSGLLFWADAFSVMLALAVMTVINIAGSLFLLLNKKFTRKKTEFDLNTAYAAVLAVGVILTANKFGFFGMGQDQGVYQVKAIDLMYGSTERVKVFEEYDRLNDEEKIEYYQSISGLAGYDICDSQKPMISSEDIPNRSAGIYHGIPTYPAMLALFGKMFGMSNMLRLHTFIYIGFILIMFYICGNFKMNRLYTVISTLIAMLSPIVIWVSKSSLTEMFLTLIFAVYLFFISAAEEEKYSFFSVIPILVYSFFHVTVYTMLPLFAAVYIYLFIVSGNKSYIWANTVACAGFAAGLNMMLFSSPNYTTNNIVIPLSGLLPFINDINCIIVLCIMAAIFLALGIIMLKLERLKDTLQKFVSSKLFSYIVIAASILLVVFCGFNIIKNEAFSSSPIHVFKTNSLVGIAYLTGIILLPAVLCGAAVKCRKMISENSSAVIMIVFIYCILFRAAFLSDDIPHYYYYARYWAPFIAVIAVMAGILITKKPVLIALSVISAGVMLPYDLAMFSGKDDTRMEWESIEDVCAFIDGSDAVVIDGALTNTLVLPVKEITEADIFFTAGGESLFERAEKIKAENRYEDIFILSTSDLVMLNDGISCVYSDRIAHSEDLQQNRNRLIPFPYSFYSDENTLFLFTLSEESGEYNIPISNISSDGFDLSESSFAWSVSSDPSIGLNIPAGYYNIELSIPEYIPFSSLNMQSFIVDISINGQIISSTDLVSENGKISFCVSPSDFINNVLDIRFHSDLWSPADYGANDMRNLGFPINNISVSPLPDESAVGKKNFSFAEDNIGTTGFGISENNEFAWSVEEQSSVIIGRLSDCDYSLNVELKNIVPVKSFDNGSYDVIVSFNDSVLGTITLDGSEGSCSFSADINASLITENNILKFSSELWSPSDFGGNDNRRLGFPLVSVEVSPIQ